MITVDIKTFKGDLFKISCDEGSKLDQLLNKIKDYSQDYNNDFLRLFDIDTEKEIKHDLSYLEDGQKIFLFISTDVFVTTDMYIYHDDEYGISVFWRPLHLTSLIYARKVDILYVPSRKVFIYDDDGDKAYSSLEELLSKECTEYPEIQKQNMIQEVMKRWNTWLSFMIIEEEE